jgi:hypothetical protein
MARTGGKPFSLTAIHRDRIEFGVLADGVIRKATVMITGGTPMFPHPLWDTGETTGDPVLDHRLRAAAASLLLMREGGTST